MPTVFWSSLGFTFVERFPKGERLDALYCCLNILCGTVTNRLTDTAEDQRQRMVLHFDNATPHAAHHTADLTNHNRLTLAPPPPFAPDLVPSDFCLFGKLKTALMEVTFDIE
jgi:hypothetical protein